MAIEPQTLAPVYQGWQTHQQHLVTTIGRLSQEQLALRAAPHIRSIGTLAAHILAVRIWWFHHVMNEGSADLEPLRALEFDDPVRCPAIDLAAGLADSWDVMLDCFIRWTPDDLNQTFKTRSGPRSRHWILSHLRDHDFHHGGELFLSCNMNRLLVPARPKNYG